MVSGLNCAEGACSGDGWWVGSMGFEELLDQVGGFGLFQVRNVFLLALARLIMPMQFLLPIFMAAVPAHRCALPGTPANFSLQDALLEGYLPQEPDGTLSSCLRFTHPQAPHNTTLQGEGQSPGELQGEPSTVPCPQGWEYDRSEFSSTIATEVPEPGGWGTREWDGPAFAWGDYYVRIRHITLPLRVSVYPSIDGVYEFKH